MRLDMRLVTCCLMSVMQKPSAHRSVCALIVCVGSLWKERDSFFVVAASQEIIWNKYSHYRILSCVSQLRLDCLQRTTPSNVLQPLIVHLREKFPTITNTTGGEAVTDATTELHWPLECQRRLPPPPLSSSLWRNSLKSGFDFNDPERMSSNAALRVLHGSVSANLPPQSSEPDPALISESHPNPHHLSRVPTCHTC